MAKDLNRLVEAGFTRAGEWVLVGDKLDLRLEGNWRSTEKVLYAFFVAGQLVYIGKSGSKLGTRMQRYKTPPRNAGSGASTNIQNNRRIREALLAGHLVEIYAFASAMNHQIGAFELDQAAGLEDSIIRHLQPVWNTRKSKTQPEKANQRAKTSETETSLTNAHTHRLSPSPSKVDFDVELQRQLAAATSAGAKMLDISAKDLHIAVGGYPGPRHAMPSCCSAMRAEQRTTDEVLAQPPKGKGASLKIRYFLPR